MNVATPGPRSAHVRRWHPYAIRTPLPFIGLLILFLLLVRLDLVAQQRLDPVAIGMGKASVATARGLSALNSNIGALGLASLGVYDSLQRVELDISIFPLGGVAGSTYLNSGDLDFVFDSKDSGVFTDSDRLRLSTLLESGRLSADVGVDVASLRLRAPGIGAIALRYGHRVRAQMNFPENFRTGVLGSGDVFSKDQRFENPEIGGEWTRGLSMAMATAWERPVTETGEYIWFPSIGMGMSVGYLEGVVHFDVDPASWAATRVIPSPAEATYRSIAVSGAYTFRTSEPLDTSFNPSDAILNSSLFSGSKAAGEGWEGGFGTSIVVLRKLRESTLMVEGSPLEAQKYSFGENETRDAILFGLSLEGIGAIKWSGRNLARNYPVIKDTLTDEKGGISNDIIYRYDTKLDTIGGFTSQLPAALRLGLGADVTAFLPKIPGDLIGSLEVAFPLNDGIGGERSTRVSIGAEWRPTRALALRSGIQMGGRVDAAMAFGIGYSPFEWLSINAATSEVTSLFFKDRRRVDAALNLVGRFRF